MIFAAFTTVQRVAPTTAQQVMTAFPDAHLHQVGEVQRGSVNLDEAVVPPGIEASLRVEAIQINTQKFTKTPNIRGIGNNDRGTNSNRIVMLQKPA